MIPRDIESWFSKRRFAKIVCRLCALLGEELGNFIQRLQLTQQQGWLIINVLGLQWGTFLTYANRQLLVLKAQTLTLCSCMTNRCDCTPDTYGPQCESKYNDCEQGSKQLCKHGICEDLERVQHGQVCSPPPPTHIPRHQLPSSHLLLTLHQRGAGSDPKGEVTAIP